jgi:hypothetical protein
MPVTQTLIDPNFDVRDARQAAARSVIEFPLDQFDTAALLGVSLAKLRSWRQQGLGPPFVRIGQRPCYRVADIREWIDSLPAGGTRPNSNSKKPARRAIRA